MSKFFEIFKVGTWNGRKFTKIDLEKIVENFKTGDPKVPLIIGHNDIFSGEKPAEGWVEELKIQGNKLMAKARNISETLKSAVNDERYPMRSVELWPDYNGKGLALGAVAFLGGSNPAVGGMADFQFAGDSSGRVHFAHEADDKLFFAYAPDALGEDFAAQNKGGGEIDMTKEQIDQMIAAALSEATPKIIEQFKAGADYQALVQQNAELTTQVQEAQQFAVTTAMQADLKDCQAFAQRMLDDKRITPATFNGGLAAFLMSLDGTKKFKFAGDTEVTQREYFKQMLQALPSNTSLFQATDTDAPRANENIDGAIAKFAADNGLDPQILAKNFNLINGSVSADDEGMVEAEGISVGHTKAPAAQ